MEKKEYSIDVGGKKMTALFSDLADQADGSVIMRMGSTAVLATAVMSNHRREDIDYFPLTVDYEERFYAAGAILGSRFVRREGRPSEEAILSGRIVDRTIRPLFDTAIRNEVQVIVTVLSIGEDDPDVLGVNAASLALATSDVPWGGPVAAVRIGKTKTGTAYIVNPTYPERSDEERKLDLLMCGKDGTINMIEVAADELAEKEIEEAFDQAAIELKKLQDWQEMIIKDRGLAKRVVPRSVPSPEVETFYREHFASKITPAVICGKAGKDDMYALKKEWVTEMKEKMPDVPSGIAAQFFEEKADECIHKQAVENNVRPDGRAFDEIRSLYAEVGLLSPTVHGSGVFYRGGTHVLSALTLGGPGDSLVLGTIESPDGKKRFIHHYNFPPFSSGETGRVGGINRRAVGHGALAEKALRPMIPPKEQFPYTIRLVSECLASNGSTSMGSTCAGTLALMDGGVPLKRPVGGIAMGLMMIGDKYKILTDIQGPEDSHGDMDFKVAGTREGITAIQLDIKLDGIPLHILKEALEHAKAARLKIIDRMEQAIKEPRKDIAPSAPKILTHVVKKDQIGLIIGPGGKTINAIREETGVEEIEIEEDGTIFITGKGGSAEAALKRIQDLTRVFAAGDKGEGEVTRLMTFGAFVRLGGQTEGLVHVSEIAPFRINKVEDVLKVGDRVPYLVKEIDDMGRYNLSIKAVDPDFAKKKMEK